MLLNFFNFLFVSIILISCKESKENTLFSENQNQTFQEQEIVLIGVNKTSGMTNPSSIKYQYSLIILKDSIYKIKSLNNEIGDDLPDTIYRKKNDVDGKNLFNFIPNNNLKNQTLGSFGVNDGQDWLIAIELKNFDYVIWKMGTSGLPEEFEGLNMALKKLW